MRSLLNLLHRYGFSGLELYRLGGAKWTRANADQRLLLQN